MFPFQYNVNYQFQLAHHTKISFRESLLHPPGKTTKKHANFEKLGKQEPLLPTHTRKNMHPHTKKEKHQKIKKDLCKLRIEEKAQNLPVSVTKPQEREPTSELRMYAISITHAGNQISLIACLQNYFLSSCGLNCYHLMEGVDSMCPIH